MGLTEKVYNELKWIIEPEFGINIVDLGFIYGIQIDQDQNVTIQLAPMEKDDEHKRMVEGIRYAVQMIDGIGKVEVVINHDTPWHPKMMNDQGRKLVLS